MPYSVLHLHELDGPGVQARVVEGVCELCAYLWEHARLCAGDTDGGERQQRIHALETSSDPICTCAQFHACSHVGTHACLELAHFCLLDSAPRHKEIECVHGPRYAIALTEVVKNNPLTRHTGV